ncbi:hypothetical protein [Flavobacterium sp. GSA192]|uniref:hypothetical protein n=1 Tax=Flavobacterium sp. GSA192 TaxID=2576304 RepID=UPI0011294166|nr:hypothetical protein [Flavobacterium sp. GSA192]
MKQLFTLFFLLPNLFLNILSTDRVDFCDLMAQSFVPNRPEVIGPSPQASAITLYGDYPVNHNTGLVDMRVPIYTVKSGSLSLPIDISFHASGRMANETNGILGMRWVLNAGGVVARTVHGYPDEWNYLTPYSVNPSQTPDYDELRCSSTEGYMPSDSSLGSNRTDSEFDIFSYVLPTGKSGKFILKNENGEKKAIQIPYEALKIEFTKDNTFMGYFGAIKITDVDGVIYNYGNGNVSNSNYCEFYDSPIIDITGSAPTGWYLKSIVSADGTDTIEFDYQKVYSPISSYSEIITAADMVRDESVNANFHQNDATGAGLFYTLEFHPIQDVELADFDKTMVVPFLKSIKFKEGELSFNYTGLPSYDSTVALDYITLSGSVDRKIKFNQELVSTEKYLRYLKGIEIFSVVGSEEKIEEKYNFDYFQPSSTAETFALYLSKRKKDWWGYYNYLASSSVLHRTISLTIKSSGSTSATNRDIGSNNLEAREPHFESMQFGMLKSITYPTGGKTEFEYELNHHKDYNATSSQSFYDKTGPGLRIKKITNKPTIGNEVAKIYKYGINENGMGNLNQALKANQNNIQEMSTMIYWDYFYLVGSTNPMKVYMPEQAGCRLRDYSSDPFINPADFGGNVVWYDTVTEYSDEKITGGYYPYNDAKNGKTIYEYTPKDFDVKNFIIADPLHALTEHPKIFADPYRLWKGGKLAAKTLYKKENEIFIPSLKETYAYTDTLFDEVWDMPTYAYVLMQNIRTKPDNSFSQTWYNIQKNYHNDICSIYGYGFRKYVSGSEKLANKTVEYFDGDGITTTTDYFYDPQYDQLRKEEITKSDGKKIRFEYEYAFDKTTLPLSDTTNVYNKMVKMNMLSLPLKKSQNDINGTTSIFTQSKRTDFFEPFANVIRPQKEYFKKGSGLEEPIIEYHNYDDKGNIIEVSQANGTHTVYIWGYEKQYPVAKIENMTYATIPVNLITAIEAASSPLTGSEASLIVALNNLRNHTALSNAMVTTYTYKPLIGISTVTDSKGDVILYEYDAFSRLKQVKDKEGNILSSNNYHYKGQ